MEKPSSLYIHIPFCATKCYYCDFNTYEFRKDQSQRYVSALKIEMEIYAPKCETLKTIFIGGGTPSILSAKTLDRLFKNLNETFKIDPSAEITVECNPGTIDHEKLAVMRSAGVNRLSFGVQSMDDQILRQIGRIHKVSEVIESYTLARAFQFDNINLDLIFALPDQTLSQWRSSLEKVISLQPEHISIYNLTLEKGTHFYDLWSKGLLKLAEDQLEAEMFETAIYRLSSVGYDHYEISNFAKPDREAKHNVVYWRNGSYVGLGAGACGYVDRDRYSNFRPVQKYVNSVLSGEKPIADSEKLIGSAEKSETIILGLRLRKGISDRDYTDRFNSSIRDDFYNILEKLISLDLIEWRAENLRLTNRGLMFANNVFMEFLDGTN